MITVLMPMRDAEATVGAAVRSVLAQGDVRLLAVDDGSRDGTVDAALAAGDGRLRILRRGRDGLIDALNAGLAAVETPLVARMDADDVMRLGRLAAQEAALARDPTLALVSSRVALVPEGSGMARYVAWLNGLETPEDVARDVFVEAPLCQPAVTMRAHILRDIGGYRDLGWPEDYDLWLRLAEAGARMAVLPEVLHDWHDSATRLTRTHPRYATEAFFRIKAHFLARRLPGAARIWGAGRDGRRLARALASEGVAIAGFIDVDPRKVGGVRRVDVPVVGPDAIGDGPPIVSAVGVPRAREQIREALRAMGLVELRDFYCAA